MPSLLLATTLSLTSCTVASSSERGQDAHPSAAQARKLDDWRIRAGLFDAHHAPSELPYVSDARIDDGAYSARCRGALLELKPYAGGLLKAPTQPLRSDAKRVHRASLAYLRACIKGRAVAWHHAGAAYDVATTDANTDYARALGLEPGRYDTPKVFP